MPDQDDLYRNCGGARVPWDDLDEAEQAYYSDPDAHLVTDLEQYCQRFWAENAADWGSGRGGSLTEEDYEHGGPKS